MDELAKRLRADADRIECTVSGQLDDRIRASLEGAQPESAGPARRGSKSFSFWWASSLTGVAVAAAVIIAINLQAPRTDTSTTEVVPQGLVIPTIQWNAETAVLTSPLEQELESLQSDLKKAEEAVKQDIERLF